MWNDNAALISNFKFLIVVCAAGYKDWAVYKLGVPSLTIEVGTENGDYVNPVPQRQFNAIWARNKNVVYATAYNLKF